MPPRRLDLVLMLRRPEEQLIVDHGVLAHLQQVIDQVHLLRSRACIPVPAQPFDAAAIVLRDDNVLRLHIRHKVSLDSEVVEGLLLHRLEMMHEIGHLDLDMLKDLNEVLSPDPFVHELVLFQDVEINAGVARLDAVDLGA